MLCAQLGTLVLSEGVIEYGEIQQRIASAGAVMPAAASRVPAAAEMRHGEFGGTSAGVAADAGLPRTTHKGYSHAIAPRPGESAPLLEGQCVAVYFEDYDDWFEGVVVASMDSVVVRFEDGEHLVPLLPETYGRFNCWVVPETGWREEWRADGHALLGRRLVHEGADGVLRMWCGARRMFAMSVCDDAATGIEAEILVPEVDAARSVAEQQPLPRQSAESEGQPPHAHAGVEQDDDVRTPAREGGGQQEILGTSVPVNSSTLALCGACAESKTQQTELLNKIISMRAANVDAEGQLHGWCVTYKVRQNDAGRKGDWMAVGPHGERLKSIVAMQRYFEGALQAQARPAKKAKLQQRSEEVRMLNTVDPYA